MEQFPDNWRAFLDGAVDFSRLSALLERLEERRRRTTVFPPSGKVFRAFELTAPEAVRVVIVGQDPYHDDNQAHGLAFSVPDGVKPPPSLRNIFREYSSDLGVDVPVSGSLERWAENGVLLLNSILTVDAHAPASHADWGWEQFTDEVIGALSAKTVGRVFILWGSYAAGKRRLIAEAGHHLVITGVHPSPLSAYRGFFGSAPFSAAERFLGDWRWEQ